jgi:hypothetical protein
MKKSFNTGIKTVQVNGTILLFGSTPLCSLIQLAASARPVDSFQG